MLDTIIITVLGTIVVIQITINNKLNYKLDILEELHKYHKDLVSITEKYFNNDINFFEYNYLIDDVNKCIEVLETEYYEDNE